MSRRLTARAVQRWRDAHPGGTVTRRDLAKDPIPHLDVVTGMARLLPADALTPAQQLSLALTVELSPRFITAELTMADGNPVMAELKPLAAESLSSASDRRALGRRPERGLTTGSVGTEKARSSLRYPTSGR